MCVIGNPPYSVSSTNKGKWIESLTSDYKKELNERNIQPLSDDYIKFIRYGQHFIEKNGSGILAYISNNSFIDGIIHRQMRKHLLESFDKIYILDLHGSTKKNETSIDGGKDENVFDIQQGVSINLFIKTGKKKKLELGKVWHFDLYGSRELKYENLSKNIINTINWEKLEYSSPNYFFTKKNFSEIASYEIGFKVDMLFKHNACGIVTARDGLVVQQHKNDLETVIKDFNLLDEVTFRNKYNEKTDSRDWTYLNAKKDLENSTLQRIDYRPFDKRFIIYSSKSKGILSYPRNEIMKHMIPSDNLGLLICKQQSTFDFQHIFITNTLSDKCSVSLQTKEATYHFPLYLYPDTNGQQTFGQTAERAPNLNPEIVNQIADKLGLTFTNEKKTTENIFAPIDILDYIYAVLHSPTYREKYKEFLRIDFPRIHYPKDKDTFWRLVKLGGEIRQIHLLESPTVEKYITQYPIDGDNVVIKPNYQNGKVYINDTQYFDNVPETAWDFYIGGYQPAQKWLKDRKHRKLEFDDILHYQKIIVALSETDRIMKEIDKIKFE
jgi:predicted helicase